MKTKTSKFTAVIILPAALLLSQCAPTATAPSRVQVSSRAPIPELRGLPVDEALTARGDSDPQPNAAEDRATSAADESPAIVLPPIVVGDVMIHPLLEGMRYWPRYGPDNKLEEILIPAKQPNRANSFPMGHSGEAWLKSLR